MGGNKNGLKMRGFVDVSKIIGIVFATVLVIAGVIIMINEAQMTRANEDKQQPIAIPVDGSEPGNAPSDEQVREWIVPAHMPRFIRIPDLRVFARVMEVGLQNEAVGVPNSIFNVGWFNGSALPGESGASMMVGHGGGGNDPSVVFDRLGHLNIGARIEIEMGDGRRFNYSVVEKKILSIEEANDYMASMMIVANDREQGLSLISCVGDWLPYQQTLDRRVMVRAVLEEN